MAEAGKLEQDSLAGGPERGARTHVYPLVEGVIDDLEETDDVWIAALFHDGNLFPDLVLGAAEGIGEREVRGCRDGALAELSHAIYSMVLALDGLDSLRASTAHMIIVE